MQALSIQKATAKKESLPTEFLKLPTRTTFLQKEKVRRLVWE